MFYASVPCVLEILKPLIQSVNVYHVVHVLGFISSSTYNYVHALHANSKVMGVAVVSYSTIS